MTSSPLADPIEHIKALLENLPSLCNGLPSSVPLATKDDDIYRIITDVNGEDTWQTFNRRFDLLFAEDCRDVNGRLDKIRRGPLGMNNVCKYLKSIDLKTPGLFHDLMVKKLERVVQEVVYLMWVLSIRHWGLRNSLANRSNESQLSRRDTSVNATRLTIRVGPSSQLATHPPKTTTNVLHGSSSRKKGKTQEKTQLLDGLSFKARQFCFSLIWYTEDATDTNYKPRNPPRNQSQSPIPDYKLGSDGFEIVSDSVPSKVQHQWIRTSLMSDLKKQKRKKPIVVDSDDDSDIEEEARKQKRKMKVCVRPVYAMWD